MAYVIATPEIMTAAATDLATIGSNVNAAHMVAAAPTTSVIPAAAEEVSTGIAQLFSQHAANYQALADQAAAFNDQFVQHLAAAAFSYTDVEAAIAAFLQNLQILNVNADLIVSALAATPPEDLLAVLFVLLTLPISIPILVVGFLPVEVYFGVLFILLGLALVENGVPLDQALLLLLL
jgi:hypothetical protein